MNRPLDLVLGKLANVTERRGGYRATCPAHDDENPSLDIAEAADGKVLLTCRSRGCTFEQIAKALGLAKCKFFPNTRKRTLIRQEADALLANRGLRPETITRFRIVANLQKQAWEFPLTSNGAMKFKRFVPTGDRDKCWVLKGTEAPLHDGKP